MSVDLLLQTTQASKKSSPAAYSSHKDEEKYIHAHKDEFKDEIEATDTEFSLIDSSLTTANNAAAIPEPVKSLLNSLIAENGDVITLNALNDAQIEALVENMLEQVGIASSLSFAPETKALPAPKTLTDSLTDTSFLPGQTALERLTQRINAFINNENPNLIATNLDAQNITSLDELKEQLAALQNLQKTQQALPDDILEKIGTLQQELAAILSSFVKIVPAQNKQAIHIKSQGSVNTSPVPVLQNAGQQAAGTPAANQLNQLTQSQRHVDTTNIFMETSQNADDAGDPIEFQKLMKRSENLANTGANKSVPSHAAANAQAAANTQAQPSAQGTLNGLPFSFDGSIFASASWGSYSVSGFDEYGMPITNASLNSASLTNITTQAQSATHAHPGTQMVAATLQKLGANGENRQITLRLDPPALGRVEVKMKIASDGKVDAVIKAEKPETHIMLQRDAQTLERAMQQLGLDADGSLSFELADQGFDFDQNDRHENGQTKGVSGHSDGEDDMEIIESTMTWFVDDRTGLMRYDLIV